MKLPTGPVPCPLQFTGRVFGLIVPVHDNDDVEEALLDVIVVTVVLLAV